MGQPAARVTDMHTCPMVTGIVPHVGGPILPPCQINVLTCMMPQARITDMAVCVGPVDVIIQGAFTVLVGGLPAARMADMTAHGGVIVTGCFTVLIGDAGGGGSGGGGTAGVNIASSAEHHDKASIGSGSEGGYSDKAGGGGKSEAPRNYGKAIKITGDETFQKQVVADLDAIKKTPSGAKLLAALEKSGKTVTIEPKKGGNSARYTRDAIVKDGKPGPGSNTTVAYDPNRNMISSEPWGTRPPAIGLAHELVHARHAAEGTIDKSAVDNDSKPDKSDPKKMSKTEDEEVRTVGLPPHENEEVTENKIRSEWDPAQPQRTWY